VVRSVILEELFFVHAVQVELLGKSKRRVVWALCVTAVVLLVLAPLRFVSLLNDALAGKPEYVRVLTGTFARQLGTQMQMQVPVIVERDEHAPCPAVNGLSLPDEQIRGTIYLLAYSEQQRLTCLTTYIIPATDPSGFSTVRSFKPAEGKNYGPQLPAVVKAIPETRIVHPYAPEYLKRLHWRYKPHFPLSPSEAASLTSQSYYSGTKPQGDSFSIDFDYGELRARVAQRHLKTNAVLSWLLVGDAALFLFLLGKLWLLYRHSSQYSRLYELKLRPGVFLKRNIATELDAARRQYFERQRETQARLREQEKLRALRTTWQESLRSALPNLTDEQLRGRVQECVEQDSQDLEQLKSLWVEVQERVGAKTPADKLNLLLESIKPYCTEQEFRTSRDEAFAVLTKSGFRAARSFAIALHDQFKARAREIEELESPNRSIAQVDRNRGSGERALRQSIP
jgi:hypothetical protein